MSKFVAKFRKNDYNDDYDFMPKRKRKDEFGQIRKMRKQKYEDFDGDSFQKSGTSKYRKSY